MSFKYRFILSFVLLEAIFITLIVTVNFVAINDSSEKLIEQNINSNMEFLDELVKIPISIYDLATLDNLVLKTSQQKHVNSIVITDAENKILSSSYIFKKNTIEEILEFKENKSFMYDNETYEFRTMEIKEEDAFLGYIYLIFDTTENSSFIRKSLENSGFIILIEILISTILSYIIGSKLTNMLTRLSITAKEIGEYKYPEVPFQNKKDEIGILSKSMAQMLVDLKDRRDKLKDLARELSAQKDELIEANKAKDDFLANMSHELKTPLNSINVISSIMMKNKQNSLDQTQVKNLSIINKCGNDLLFLINDVLDISKLEAGEVTLDFRTIVFKNLMNEIKDMFEPQVLEKGLRFYYDIPDSILKIYSDDNRIKQIVKNLLSNALKFVNDGCIKLVVKDLGFDLQIIVEDEGIGIEQNKLEHIFDRFKQADGSTTRKYGGTGLGLAICKELSNLLGGDINVKSKVNEGTTFIVTLPKNLEKVDFEDEVRIVFSKSKDLLVASDIINNDPEIDFKQIDNKDASKPEVLLLNSDPLAFMSSAIALKEVSTLEQVSTLIDLLKYLKIKKYDKIIIDISKIDINEFKKILEKLSYCFIVIYDDENSLDPFIKEKVSKIIKKPIDVSVLLSAVKEA